MAQPMTKRARLLTALLAGLAILLLAVPTTAGPSQGGTPPRVGEIPAPALGTSRDRQPVDLEALRGKVVIVTFWATWCPPCLRELPVLANFQRVIGDDALQVVAINYKEDRRTFNDFVRRVGPTGFLWIHDARGVVSDDWGIRALPRMFAIDQTGKVAFTHAGYSHDDLPKITRQVIELLPPEVRARPPRHLQPAAP